MYLFPIVRYQALFSENLGYASNLMISLTGEDDVELDQAEQKQFIHKQECSRKKKKGPTLY